MNYDVNYFIDKFSKIPEEKWTTKTQQNAFGQRCAIGHCMPIYEKSEDACCGGRTPEGASLLTLFKDAGLTWDYDLPAVAIINNGDDKRYQQPTPKQRILAALYDIKKMQDKEEVGTAIPEPTPGEVMHGEFIPVTFSQIQELQSAN